MRMTGFRNTAYKTWVLMERNVVNYSRNVFAFGIRSECVPCLPSLRR